MKKRLFVLLLAAAVILSLAACGSGASSGASSAGGSAAASAEASKSGAEQETPASGETSEAPASVQPGEASEESAAEASAAGSEAASAEGGETAEESYESLAYPVAEGETLSIFMMAPGGPPCVRSTWAEYEIFDVAAEATGVSLDWHEADMFSFTDQLQLLIASGDLTDIVANVQSISGGLVGAYENELICDLKDYIETSAPDYWYWTRQKNDLSKDLLTDEGYELSMPVIMSDLDAEDGLCIRQDWLDALGLEAPRTYEELDQVLGAIKSEYNPSEVVFMDQNLSVKEAWLACGYGVGNYDVVDTNPSTAFYLKDGSDTVTTALLEDGYKDYIGMMADWYAKGYLSRDFISNNYNDSDKQGFICSDNLAFFWASADSLATYYSNTQTEGFKLATLGLISEDGSMDKNHYCVNFLVSSMSTVSVSTNCADPELAVKYLNYWYTEDGYMLMNCGVEGQTYNLVDGKIEYTELVTANPEFPDMNANGMLMRYNCQGKICGVQLLDSKDSIYTREQLDAIDTWAAILDNAYTMPYGVTLTTAETTEITETLNSISTYASEQILAFAVGERDLAEWDDFTAQIREMGMEDCVATYQAAYDRYNKRG